MAFIKNSWLNIIVIIYAISMLSEIFIEIMKNKFKIDKNIKLKTIMNIKILKYDLLLTIVFMLIQYIFIKEINILNTITGFSVIYIIFSSSNDEDKLIKKYL